jgi:hypothetical protein
MSDEGALLFARYAYPPNALGYCGPAGADAMLAPGAAADIERRARQFDGAWCYLEFLASSAGLADPLDARVVEAYWVGNDLLDGVDPAGLVAHLTDRFHGQFGGTWRDASARAAAHHSFQVFEVYPWLALLHAGGSPTALSVLDRCRIRTGTVVSVRGEVATVTSRPLVWDGTATAVGEARQEKVRWSVDGMALIGGLSPGDPVALHWDWICDVVTDEQAARIEAREAAQLAALEPSTVNR